MRQVPGRPLRLGHVGDARDLRSVTAAGIVALVDLAANEPPTPVLRDMIYCRFPLLDGSGNPLHLLRLAISTLVDLLRADVSTLVFCSAGMSRTPAVAAAALARLDGIPLAAALDIVLTAGPADISPALLAEVRAAML